MAVEPTLVHSFMGEAKRTAQRGGLACLELPHGDERLGSNPTPTHVARQSVGGTIIASLADHANGNVCSLLPRDSGIICSTDLEFVESRLQKMNRMTECWPDIPKQRALGLFGRPEYSDHHPGIVREDRAHEKTGVAIRGAHFIEELFAYAGHRSLLAAQALHFLEVENTQFPILDHGAMRLFFRVGAAKHIAEFVWQLCQLLGLPAEEIELA